MMKEGSNIAMFTASIRVFRKFTTAFFLWASGLVAATADMLQKPDVAFYTAIILAIAAIACLVRPKFVIDGILRKILRLQIDQDFSSLPFAATTLAVALALFVSSQLTANASEGDRSGYLSETFPELHSIQVSLGLVNDSIQQIQQQQAALKKDTSDLVDASARWMQIELRAENELMFNSGPEGHSYIGKGGGFVLTNETNYLFDDVNITLSIPGEEPFFRRAIGFMKNHDGRWQDNIFETPFEIVTVCASAKRRDRDEWLLEEITYKREHPDKNGFSLYFAHEASGLKTSPTPLSC